MKKNVPLGVFEYEEGIFLGGGGEHSGGRELYPRGNWRHQIHFPGHSTFSSKPLVIFCKILPPKVFQGVTLRRI